MQAKTNNFLQMKQETLQLYPNWGLYHIILPEDLWKGNWQRCTKRTQDLTRTETVLTDTGPFLFPEEEKQVM